MTEAAPAGASGFFVRHQRLGVEVACDPAVVAPEIRAGVAEGWYELEEAELARSVIGPEDRVLELGGGLGAVAAFLHAACRPARHVVVEPNPEARRLLAATLERNGAAGVEVVGGVLTRDEAAIAAGQVDFFIAEELWSSSLAAGEDTVARRSVPALDFRRFAKALRPTVILCDIEGGELDLFGGPARRASLHALLRLGALGSVEWVVMELHPDVIGSDGVRRVTGSLEAHGLHPDAAAKEGTVVRFRRHRLAPGSRAAGAVDRVRQAFGAEASRLPGS